MPLKPFYLILRDLGHPLGHAAKLSVFELLAGSKSQDKLGGYSQVVEGELARLAAEFVHESAGQVRAEDGA